MENQLSRLYVANNKQWCSLHKQPTISIRNERERERLGPKKKRNTNKWEFPQRGANPIALLEACSTLTQGMRLQSIKCLRKQGWVKKGRLVANELVLCKSVVSRRLRATTAIGHEVVMSGKEVAWQMPTWHAFSWILLIQLFGSNYWLPTFVDGECAYVFGYFVDVLYGNIIGWNLGRDILLISRRKGGHVVESWTLAFISFWMSALQYLETLGFWPMMPKNLLRYWYKFPHSSPI